MRTRALLVAAVLLVLVAAGGCDGGDDEPRADASASGSATTDSGPPAADEPVEVVERFRPRGCRLPALHTDAEIVGHVLGAATAEHEHGIRVRSYVDSPGAGLDLEVTRAAGGCTGTARLTGGSGPDMEGLPRREVQVLGMVVRVARPAPSEDVPNRAETTYLIPVQ